MLQRQITPYLQQFTKQYPIVTVTGPRQSGKSTLVKTTFPHYKYVSLEDPDIRQFAQNDPREFLQNYACHVIFDEVQRVPELFSYLQTLVDQTDEPGQFILTGSEQFEISHNISQSLAGRTAIIRLLGLSQSELFETEPQQCWHHQQLTPRPTPRQDKYTAILNGGYPRIVKHNLNPFQFYRDYFETYVTRDLRQMTAITDIDQFITFVRVLAGWSGCQLNYAAISKIVGVSETTIRRWIAVLQQSYLITLQQPYYKNFKKRLVKSPKLFFLDTGLLCYLLNIRNVDQLKTHPQVGEIFETYIISELLKNFYNACETPYIYYWNVQNQGEVDVLIELTADQYCLAEIKLASTIIPSFFKGFTAFDKAAQPKSSYRYLIYGGGQWLIRNQTQLIPWFGVG